MTLPTLKIVDNFYHASWDLAENLFRLHQHASDAVLQSQISVLEPDASIPLTPPLLAAQFRKYATPFLDLTGDDLPKDQHLAYMQIEDCLNETVFPALDILSEDWAALQGKDSNALQMLREGCSHLRCEIELTIIPQASGMVRDMTPRC